MSEHPDRLTVTLTAVGDGPPVEIRLRKALKSLLRHGIRATWPGAEKAADAGPWACPNCGGLLFRHGGAGSGFWLQCDGVGGCGAKVQMSGSKPVKPLRSFKAVVEADKGRQVHR